MQSTKFRPLSISTPRFNAKCLPTDWERQGEAEVYHLGGCEGVGEECEEFLLGTQLFHKSRNMYYHSLCPEGLKKARKNLSQHS
jgi:hypothetical protein